MALSLSEALLNTRKGNRNPYGDPQQNEILYSGWKHRYAETIDDFYRDFIKDRLPDPDVVRSWHRMLLEYAATPGAVFPIRDGNTKNMLRRGWLVRVNNEFSYMFADNDLASYIYKMALDGFCPEKKDFFECMTAFKAPADIDWLTAKNRTNIKNPEYQNVERRFVSMPVHFNQIGGKTYPDKAESEQNAFINTAPAPVCCLGEYGYKHAHIFDVKGTYCINGQEQEWKHITTFDLGRQSDYKWDPAIGNFAWDRQLPTREKDALKQLAIAHFLRFLDPINHFLSPMLGNNKFTKWDGEFSLDIAEYEHLQLYMMEKKEALFGQEFLKYRKTVCAPAPTETVDPLEKIDLVYHEKSVMKPYQPPRTAKAPKTRSSGKSAGAARAGGKRQSYEFEGQNYTMRRMILTLIKRYINDHPHTTYPDLKNAFDIKLQFNRQPLIRLESELSAGDIRNKQAFEDRITLADGHVIAINNQPQRIDMPAMIQIAGRLGYTITPV